MNLLFPYYYKAVKNQKTQIALVKHTRRLKAIFNLLKKFETKIIFNSAILTMIINILYTCSFIIIIF